MKKAYEKPQLFTELFQPADAIAGPCGTDVHFSEKTCTLMDEDLGLPMFTAENGACESQWQENGSDDKGCYHIPVDGLGYFGS